ncbi:undecaprenyl-diphosphatase UppP [Alkalicoccus halolimnae]|uniref:Undecaprenyl-diphosphatase n=1 Tax=Alkalicoccus halolimnae TaxID=1667239 RepID=A0A5C7FFG2_9BACI|nr:undecaprenyl-diphosphatase UppP [Alkalicoccus halolimnae]TXF83064.1 undecaprenyl-diphosphatase UppP [Alkalicoccus halolimnae]
MSLIEAIIFGIVQGISEFLPISSTAHIVITQLLFGYSFPGLAFEIFLHLASVLAVMLYFWRDIWQVAAGFCRFIVKRKDSDKTMFNFGVYILIATFITGALGYLFSDFVGESMKTPVVIATALALTGVALIFIERVHRTGNKTPDTMTKIDAVIIGLVQTLAVLPGISRSGATLVAALIRGLDRDTAVRYSFLLAIPVILGSTLLGIGDVTMEIIDYIGPLNLIVSFIISFIFSILGIIWLIDFLKKSRLIYFAVYCFLLAAFVLVYIDLNTVMEV